jgi:hypothetical protein
VSVKATNAIPTAAGRSVLKSSNDTDGTLKAGSPAGTDPTTGSSSARSSTATTTVAATTARKTPGTLGATRRSARISASDPTPIASAVVSVWSSPAKKSRVAGDEVLGVHREAEQLRKLRDDDGDRDAHQIAQAHRHRQQFGQEAESREPARRA